MTQLVGSQIGNDYSNPEDIAVTANTDAMTVDFIPRYDKSFLYFYIVTDTAGVFSVVRINDGTSVVEKMFGGEPLIANTAYVFTVLVRDGDTFNVQHSVNCNFKTLILKEII